MELQMLKVNTINLRTVFWTTVELRLAKYTMKTVIIREAKMNLAKLIQEACEGKEIIISRADKPVIRLVPIANLKGGRQPGALCGKLRVGPKFFEPLSVKE